MSASRMSIADTVQGGHKTPFKFSATPLKLSPLQRRGISSRGIFSAPRFSPVSPMQNALSPGFEDGSGSRKDLFDAVDHARVLGLELDQARQRINMLETEVGSLQAQLERNNQPPQVTSQPAVHQNKQSGVEQQWYTRLGFAGAAVVVCLLVLFGGGGGSGSAECAEAAQVAPLSWWQWITVLVVAGGLRATCDMADKLQKIYSVFTIGLYATMLAYGQYAHNASWLSWTPFFAFTWCLVTVLVCHRKAGLVTEQLQLVLSAAAAGSYFLTSISSTNTMAFGLGIFLMLLSFHYLVNLPKPRSATAPAKNAPSPYAAHPGSSSQFHRHN